jgi:hyperosmotically inducible protein
MSIRKIVSAFVSGGCLLAFSFACSAQETQGTKPDNTGVNKRDRAKSEPTADQQKENKSDRTIAKEIRSAIVADKSLSTYAHNVKVISEHGNVTLKGPVRSEEEKKTVEAKATEVAGAGKVTNELSIKADNDNDADRKAEKKHKSDTQAGEKK